MFDELRTPAQKIQVEVILVKTLGNELEIKTDEKAEPMIIPRSGIALGIKPKQDPNAVKLRGGHLAVLTLTERRAVTVGLA